MPTLVDTSVWIDLFRGEGSEAVERLKQLAGFDELIIGDLILAEILQGVRSDRERADVEAVLDAFDVVPLVGELGARQSAENYRALRKRGITVRKTMDCLIASWCIRHNVPLLHSDRDFEPFAALGLIEA